MRQHASLHFVAFAILVLPCRSYYFGDYKVLISHSSEAKVGEETAFDAEVVLKPDATSRYIKDNENIIYEFSWKVSSAEQWIKHNQTTHRWNSFRWRWSSDGQKTVYVYARILVGNAYGRRNSTEPRRFQSGFRSYRAMNHTQVSVSGSNDQIYATLEAYQNSSENKNNFIAGTVNFTVKIYGPDDLDLDNIIYDWNFGDGTQLQNSHLRQLSHNFTTVASCTVMVTLHALSHGRQYTGTAYKNLCFKANVKAYLVIESSPCPKLPSDQQKIAKNSPVTFKVKFKDPFKAVTGVSIDWDFGDSTVVTNSNNTTISHTYNTEGRQHLWVTVRVNTQYHNQPKLDPISRNLVVQAPVSLKVQHKHVIKDKPVTFHISCNGSLPVSFHWCVSRHCNQLHIEYCSPTMEHKSSCSLIVNHTFRDSGKYCVNVGVMNDVSDTNTSLMVQIPGDPAPKHSTGKGKTAVGVLIAIFVICLVLFVIVIAVRRWHYSRREKTEKANFDFRDDDDISLSSLYLFERPSCFPWCGNSGSCAAESVPLCNHAADSRCYTL